MRSERGVQSHILSSGLPCQNSNYLAHYLIQIDIPPFDTRLCEKTAQTLYYFGCPQIGTFDIRQNCCDLLQVWHLRLKHQFRGFGVAEDGAQRLIEFVRDRCRQFSGGHLAVQMRKLGHALARLDLSSASAPMFVEKTEN